MTAPSAALPTIGVLGSGPVGQGIAELLSRAGYAVSLGTRRPDSAALEHLPQQVQRTTFDRAAQADVVFLPCCTAHPATWSPR